MSRLLFLLALSSELLALPCSAAFYAAAGTRDITPDPGARTVWIAGYGDTGRSPLGVHDALHARGVMVSDGERTVALVAVDLIGLFHEDVEIIRRRLGLDPRKQALFLAATHTHAGPDTLGLWGRFQGVSGVDARYRRRVQDAVVELVTDMSRSLQEADLISSVRPIEMKGRCKDYRDPVVMDPDLAVLRFRAKRDKSPIGTLVSWSCHPEVLGRENRYLSADFPGAVCAGLEKESGAPCAYFSGAIGGMQSPDDGALLAREGDAFAAMKALGESIAQEAVASLETAGRSEPARVDFRAEPVRLTIENSKFLAFLPTLSFGHTLFGADGAPLGALGAWARALKHMAVRLAPGEYPRIDTEVMRVRFGPVDILGVPGELFPELWHGGYEGKFRFGYPLTSPANAAPPDLALAPKGPYLKDRMKGPQRFVIGLANDEIGYIIPEYDYKTGSSLLMYPFPPGHHYEESNSVGKSTAGKIVQAAEKVLSDE